MLRNILDRIQHPIPEYKLFDEHKFYSTFVKDIKNCKSELIIESAYMTTRRVQYLLPYLKDLKKNRVRVVINTRNPEEHDLYLCKESRKCLSLLLEIGIQVIFSKTLHRKTAIIDRNILWEGSLNILSQNNSQEVMRRTESAKLGWQMIKFSRLDIKIS
jgi:phosphatidylserine/phosphatidylglycerophosphate/cardiolipin synthase-like enzyme